MDVAADMYHELYCLENSVLNMKTKEENSRIKTNKVILTKSIE